MQRRRVEKYGDAIDDRQQGADGKTERMECRQEIQHHIGRVEVDTRLDLLDVGQQIGV